jgi:hypothetical protein
MHLIYENLRHFDAQSYLKQTCNHTTIPSSNKITKKGRLSGAGGNHEVLSEANLNAT